MFRDLVLRDAQLMKDGDAVIYHGEQLLKTVNITDKKKHDIIYICVYNNVGYRDV